MIEGSKIELLNGAMIKNVLRFGRIITHELKRVLQLNSILSP
jgi:hypothetical protein